MLRPVAITLIAVMTVTTTFDSVLKFEASLTLKLPRGWLPPLDFSAKMFLAH